MAGPPPGWGVRGPVPTALPNILRQKEGKEFLMKKM